MNRPLVSCIVSTYCRPSVLLTVEDALAQVGVEVEVLVYDDGPTDWGARLPRDERLRYMRLPRCSLNFKKGLALADAHGEWSACFDDDDRSRPGRLLHQLSEIESNCAEGHCFSGSLVYRDCVDGKVWRRLGSPAHFYDGSMVLRTATARRFPVPDGLWATGHWLIAAVREACGPQAWCTSEAAGWFEAGLNDQNRERCSLTPPGWELLAP